MRTLISYEQAKALDACAQSTLRIPEIVLMERAGIAVARVLLDVLPKDATKNITLLALCGSGNNGGDALVVARELHQRGCNITIGLVSDPKTDASKLQLNICTHVDIPILRGKELEVMISSLSPHDWVIDGITGIGLTQAYNKPHIISLINASASQVLSIDVPTGLLEVSNWNSSVDAISSSHALVHADYTVTIGIEKTAMYVDSQRTCCGTVVIADTVFPKEAVDRTEPEALLFTREDIHVLMPKVKGNVYKHSRGVVALACGSHTSPGAAVLAVEGASEGPAGLIYALVDKEIQHDIIARAPHVVTGRSLEDIKTLHAMSIGSGWGVRTAQDMLQFLDRKIPLVLDADALHALPGLDIHHLSNAVLTPHVGELKSLYSALSGTTNNAVHWWQMAETVAAHYDCVVCAKHSVTYIASPYALPILIEGNNPLMASGGNGDVLAGLLGSIIAYQSATRQYPDTCVRSTSHDCDAHIIDSYIGSTHDMLLRGTISGVLIQQEAGRLVAEHYGTAHASHIVKEIKNTYSIART